MRTKKEQTAKEVCHRTEVPFSFLHDLADILLDHHIEILALKAKIIIMREELQKSKRKK